MDLKIRPAESSDASHLYTWRNEILSREMSFDTSEISLDQHVNWFSAALSNPNISIFIGENERLGKIGVCRFELLQEEKRVQISVIVSPNARGMGFGKSLIRQSISKFEDERNYPIIAKIKPTNLASVSLFKSCGFKLEDSSNEELSFQYSRES